ncbi:phosphoesterase [Niabella ginsenosidivorans]|uniref:Phosphoesterase n=1 Tax=Niabella ginsenosidivorans TaxID=1176587 RepID=A0A1A9I8Z0_9BACT|nr:phosphoesterase [Niabella ginsenosidivorans]
MSFIISAVLLLSAAAANAQEDSTQTAVNKTTRPVFAPGKVSYKSYVLPAVLIGYGTVATIIRENKNGHQNQVPGASSKEGSIFLQPENYTALAPAATVAALNLLGIKGKHRPAEEALLYALSAGISSAIVYPLKNNIKVLRPDQSDLQSFPSGHSSIAFVSAEFLRREYGDQSPWYTVAGYAAATTTAIIRVAKNEHWVTDVFAGAGIGIASTTTAYWIYNKIKKQPKKGKQASTFLLPVVSDRFYGIYLVKLL